MAFLAAPTGAAASDYVPGRVIVKYRQGTTPNEQRAVQEFSGVQAERSLPGGSKQVQVDDGQSVRQTAAELNADPKVAYAVPDYVAHAAALYPDDPGFRLQWNFSGTYGIHMPDAWSLARRMGSPGGRGTVVAVLDTGVAYRNFKRYRRVPDLRHFVRGYDFVDEDHYPFDLNGHGTHVAGTIAESTNNRIGAAGVAYRARIMPVRVLDAEGAGDTIAISRAIRWATRHHAQVINLSLEFDSSVRASQIPDVVRALHYARKRGVTVVAAAGNQADSVVAYPARASDVIAVAATTDSGCEADYSNAGRDVDVAAPGGGANAPNDDNDWDLRECSRGRGRDIYQQTFTSSIRRFGLPGGYEGTSMAAPHVSGLAALIIGTHRLGRHPKPRAIQDLIERTARDIGPPGFDVRYGYGLIDAAAALRK
ncbi:MAG: S8 family serine peptidase [Thermoleophilaceae bacterium]